LNHHRESLNAQIIMSLDFVLTSSECDIVYY